MEKEKLKLMPIFQLKRLDIKTKEEELLIQEILNEKMQNEPKIDPNRIVFSSKETDAMTPEKEAQLQAIMEQKTKKVEVPQMELTEPEVIKMADTVKEILKKPFCQFCNSKGVRHKKECTRLSANINNNV